MIRKGSTTSVVCLIFLISILQVISGYAQVETRKIGELKTIKPTVEGIDSLNKAAFSVFRTDPVKTRYLAMQALEFSRALAYRSGEGKALNYMGMTFHLAGDYDSSAYYYRKSLDVFNIQNDTSYIGKIYNNLAFLYSDQEYYNLAIEYNLKSLKIAEYLKDTLELLHCYNNIGVSYEDMREYDKAMGFFRKMLTITKYPGYYDEDYFSAISNIGLILIYKEEFDSAAVYLNKGLKYFISVEDNYGIEQSYCDLGLLYLKTNQFDLAEKAFAESDRYAAILEDKKTILINGYHFAELSFNQGKFLESGIKFKEMLRKAKMNNFLKIEMDSYFFLSRIDSINQNFRGALENFQAGVMVRDRLKSLEVQKQISEQTIQYETQKKDQEISLLKQEKEIQILNLRRHILERNLLVLILFIFTCFVGFIIFSRWRTRMANTLLAKQNDEIASKNAALLRHEEQLEFMVDKRTAELLAAKEKAEESERLKSAFLANMSHEIRTPLNGILGFMELLEEKDISQRDQQIYFSIIRKSSDRLLNTINNIIDFSKIESGQMQVKITVFSFTDRVKFLIDFFTPEAQQKGLELINKTEAGTGSAMIRSDQHKLDAIFTNLIKNAIKYTDQGGIEIAYQIENGMLLCQVKDSGIGIPMNRIHTVFDRFTQIHDNLNRSFEGSGLGLAISRAYVEMLRGSIEVYSEVGKGSEFKVRIPV